MAGCLKSGVGGTMLMILKHNMKPHAILPPLQNDQSATSYSYSSFLNQS